MPPNATTPPIRPNFTRAQLRALARVGRQLAPEIRGCFDDERVYRAVVRAFDTVDDALDGVADDPLELDIESLADHFAEIRSNPFAVLMRSRIRDLLAVLILWRAAEKLDAGDLLDAEEAMSNPVWRAEVLDLLLDRGVEVTLPGEERGI